MRVVLAAMLSIVMAASPVVVQARETVPIVNYENRSVGRALSDARVRQAIVAAIQKAKWTVAEETSGRLVTSLTWNDKHTIKVEIRYSGSTYSIVYSDSTNMNYFRYGATGPVIHPAYNQRVKSLLDAIEQELRQAAA